MKSKSPLKSKERKFFSFFYIFLLGLFSGYLVHDLPKVSAIINKANPTDTSYQLTYNSEDKSPLLKNTVEIHRSCYSLTYDCRTKNALWVYEYITPECITGNVDRKQLQFKEDTNIPKIFRATLEDYKKSGFDRGHLAPAANHKNLANHMDDTFYLTNISPQEPRFNRGYWALLEKYVRNLTNVYGPVEVYTGPLYLPYEESDGTRWIKYRVIGKNDIAVPTHFFKVIAWNNSKGGVETASFILPNREINSKNSLDEFKVSIQNIEKVAGFYFQSKK